MLTPALCATPAEFFERPSTEAKRRALRSIIFGLCFCELWWMHVLASVQAAYASCFLAACACMAA